MTIPLSVLIVEDVESDAELLVRALKKAGYDPVYEQVDTDEAFRSALNKQSWEIVISDYRMPQFDGFAALKILREMDLDVPFIVVSGTIGEETAVSMMRAGAQDYLVKGDLARLSPAVERELNQASLRRDRRRAEDAQRKSEASYQALVNSINDAIISTDEAGVITGWNPAAERIFGYAADEIVGESFISLISAHGHQAYEAGIRNILEFDSKSTSGSVIRLRGMRKNGMEFPLELSLSFWFAGQDVFYTAVIRDITDRLKVEESLRNSQEKIRDVFNAMEEGMALNELVFDEKGEVIDYRILEVNPAYEDIAMLKREDVVGKLATEVYGMSAEYITDFWKEHIHDTHSIKTDYFVEETGQWRHVSTSRPIGNRFATVFFDITEQKSIELALRASEKKLRTITENAAEIIVELDRQGQMVYISRVLPGYKLEDVVGKNFIDWVEPQFHAEMQDCLTKVFTEGTMQTYEACGYGENGELRWYLSRLNPVINDGRVVRAILVSGDITERKQAEQNLRESEEWHRAIIQTAMDGFCVVDMQGKFVEVNETYCRITGYSAEELLSLSVPDLEYNESTSEVRARIERVVSRGEDRFESKHRRKDGSIIDFEVSIQYRPFNGGRLIAFLKDITDRKQADEALRASEQRFRSIFEQSPIGMGVMESTSGRFLEVNPKYCEIVGRTATEMLSLDFKSITHPDDQGIDDENRWRMLHDEIHSFNFEKRYIRPDNSIVWVHLTVVALWVGPEDRRVNLTMVEDISERKQAELKLRESEERFRKIFQTISVSIWEEDFTEAKAMVDDLLVQGVTDFPAYFDTHPEFVERALHHTQVVDVNETTLRLYGADDKSELLGSLENIVTPQNFLQELGVLSQGLPHLEIETVNTNLRGERIIFWMTLTFFRDSRGRYKALVSLADITARKRAEESLRISEKRYHELFNSMIDGFALHEVISDEGGTPVDYRFLEVNPAYERLTGLHAEAILGRTAHEVLPAADPYWVEVYANVAMTGRSTFFENYSSELDRYFEVSAYCPRPGQFAVIMVDITERKRAEEGLLQHLTELELLYQSGLGLGQSLDPKPIGRKILNLLREKLNWHFTSIHIYHPQDDSLELLDVNQPGYDEELARDRAVNQYRPLVTRPDQGLCGWVVLHGDVVRSGDVSKDPRYIEAYSGINSGLYVPMKVGDRVIGVISVEDQRPNAFTEADERLVVTLANQAQSAFENARLFGELRKRAVELETLNRISLALRTASRQDEMLSIVLEEALGILNTLHGSIILYNKATDKLEKVLSRGWTSLILEAPQKSDEGLAGRVFTTGEIHISREFARDPFTKKEIRNQMIAGWGGACLPIRSAQQTMGVLIVWIPSERELSKDEIRLLSILSEMTGAALQRLQLHEQTVRRLEQLKALRTVDQAIASSRDMHLTLGILLANTATQLGVSAADVLLLHPSSNQLELVANYGFRTLLVTDTTLGESFAGRAIIEHRPMMMVDYETVKQHSRFGKLWREEGFSCYWVVPLIVKGEVKGALEVYCRDQFTPDADWLEFLEAMAGQAAIAIDNTQLFENLQRANLDLNLAYDATIEGWSRAMDLRDHETEGHTLRVTDLTLKLARAMRVSDSRLMAYRRGALLHDIGKMGVPDSILLKEGPLTEEEWIVMRKHPQLAREMLSPITYLKDSLDIPYAHHERWDGTGYPHGLTGESIPLAARIFAIVDVWDALTNDRTYRKKWGKKKARQYIKEQSGKHFDPQVVEVFLQLIENT